MYRSYLIIALLFLTGCTPPPSSHTASKTVQMRHSAYLGKKIGIFIMGAGVPYAKNASSGKIVYAWNSKRSSPYPRILHEREEHWMDGECEVRLYTKPNGRIYAIYALEDSTNNWHVDACAYYLK